MKRFEEQVPGTCPKNSNWVEFVELVAGTKAPLCVPTSVAVAMIVKRLSECIDCLLGQILVVAGRWLLGGSPAFRIPYPWNSWL